MTAPSELSSELRILHWNVHSWLDPATRRSNTEALLDLLAEHAPHVATLVEVNEPWGEPSRVADVAARGGYSYVFAPVLEYGEAGSRGGFGNAVMSRIPVTAAQQRLVTWPPTLYDGTEPSEPRALLLVTVQPREGHLVRIGATHLPQGNASSRATALENLTMQMNELPAPWIICGDFNAAPDAWLAPSSPFSVAPTQPAPTHPIGEPRRCIDYAVGSTGSRVSGRVLDSPGSDHLPVLVTLTV
jgi:endonuclease/exonuclease/phosphatase family metal-dependent hydrolase